MSGNRVLAILLAVAAGGFVYPLAAQQGPTTTQSTPGPTTPGAAGPQSAPQPQPDASGIPPSERPQARPGAPAPQAGQAPSAPGRRAFSPPAPGGMVSLNFNRADLVEIIHIVAQQLRLTYTIDPEVKGTVTINSAEPLRPEDLLPVFHQLLRMNGAVAVRTGNLYHIMPIKDGKGLARPVGQSREDSFALQIIPVRFFSVSEMKKVLTPFLQPGAELIENPRGNFLIVMDLPSNIQRLMEIADLIDVQVFAGARMEIYHPKVASAEELSQEMTKVMQSFAASTPQTENFAAQFIPLPRINQLLVISHSEAAWTYARRWLDRIDIVAEPGRRIFIYPVENGKATELADVLNQAFGQASTGSKTASQTLQSLHRSTPGGTGQQQGYSGNPPSSFGNSSLTNQPRTTTGSAFAAIPAPGQMAPPPTATPPQPQATPGAPGVPRPTIQPGPGSPQQQEQLRIVADPATNSLIIYSTAHEFQNIKNILRDLDAVPRQVLIEAMILQVDLNDTESFGVDYEIFRGSRTIFGQTFSSRGALRALGDLFPTAPAFGASSGLSGIVGGQDLRALINALMTDSRVKLISSPSVLAADNRPARIQVGSEEPIATGTIAQAVGGVAQSTSIQYRNTGRILTIIPQVNSKGLVNLQLKAEVSARGDDVQVGADTFPAFNTQDAETTAVVQDGETLVIGGLIGERKSRGRSGIPYLMDIPVIGRFFGTTSDESRRTELIMLITPRVVRNFDEARNVTAEFKSKVSTVRTELERIERDREKLQPKPSPEQLPPMPAPPASYPQAPNAAPNQLPPADRGAAAIAPFAGNVTVQPNGAPRQSGMESPSPVRQPIAATNELNRPNELLMNSPAASQIDPATVARPPAYALSIVKQNVETPKIAVAKPAEAISAKPTEPVARVTPARTWTVQVAAVAALKDAERLAGQLRKDGYEAYVVTAQLDSKTWHRVRIGQLERLKDALELKKALANNRQFKDPYVAAR